MNNFLSILSVLIFSFGTVFSQQELKENQFEGYIIMKNGDRRDGIIEISNINLPWSFQETIKFFDKSLLDNKKVKKSEKEECKPGDVIEYGIEGRRYLVVSYSNKNNVDGNALNSAIGLAKNLSQTKFYAELYREGKVSLYRFYNSPPEFYITSGEQEGKDMHEYIEKCKNEFDILIEKGEEKAKAFDDVNIKKFFKDCDYVVKKYQDKKYTKQPVKGLKSMVQQSFIRGDALAAAAMEMIEDYEANCAK
ncbi:MAG: hypothetical protein H6567_02080 [Lewinellaceae bacterium]|nr:hypothetical protein [Lewinellaceae bacterium]